MSQRKNGKLLLNPYFLLSKIVLLVAMQLKLKARPILYQTILTIKFIDQIYLYFLWLEFFNHTTLPVLFMAKKI